MRNLILLLGFLSLNGLAQTKVPKPLLQKPMLDVVASPLPTATPTASPKQAKETIDGRSLLMGDPRKVQDDEEDELPASCTSIDGTIKMNGEAGYETCVQTKNK